MPNPTLILGTVVVAAVATVAAAMLILAILKSATTQRPTEWPMLAGTVVGVAAGVAWMGVAVHWPPNEDQDRLLLIVWPALVFAEIVASLATTPRWLAFSLRAIAATIALPTLLWGTVYLSELAGPGTREWSSLQIAAHVIGYGAVLTAVACGVRCLAKRDHARSVLIGTSAIVAGSAVIVMLSGYASGGQLGFPLLGAMAGVWVTSLLLRRNDITSVISLGVVASGTLLTLGSFFGKLPITHAAAMFVGLLLGWLTELPWVRGWNPQLRAVLRVILMLLPTVVALVLAQQRFVADSAGYGY